MGVIRVTAIINIENNYINNEQPEDNTITVKPTTDNKYITFKDKNIQDWALANFDKDKDGKISYEEAAQVTSEEFNNANLSSVKATAFDELQYFIGLQDIKIGDFLGLESITFPKVALKVDCIRATNIHIQYKFDSRILVADNLIVSNEASLVNLYSNVYVKNFIVDENSINYSKVGNFLLSKDKNKLITCDQVKTSTIIPNSVNTIDNAAITQSLFTNITIPDTVTTIGTKFSSAFLETIDIGQNVKYIDKYFAYNPIKLKKVIFRGKIDDGLVGAFRSIRYTFDIYVRDEDVDYYKGILQAPYNTYVKPISTMN